MTRVRRDRRGRFVLVHQTPGRFRLKSNQLKSPHLDVDYVSALVGTVAGVRAVRINAPAGSVVVRHDGAEEIRYQVLDVLNNLPGEAYLPEYDNGNGPDLMEVAARAGAAALTPFLPLPIKALVGWFLALPGMAKGADVLMTEGLKVDVLDATVKFFSLMRGDYFTANTVGALLAAGEYLERTTERKTNDLLGSLLRPQVDEVRVERGGVELMIPFEEAAINDVVVCGPGELVPVDGRVLKGEASVNMSSVTGESAPVHVKPGDDVLSGGALEDGKLYIEARQVGSDTSMARIAGYLEKSLRTKSVTQRKNEEMADRLVPLTFGAGLGLYALTGDLSRAASVLTVDYSCAVKLSTPVAVRSAMFSAGQEGVLIKGAESLELLSRVDTFVFDKTGTLTRGVFEVTDVIPLHGQSPDQLLALAAGAERHYSHPVARAVVREARNRGLDLPAMSQVDFVVAHGVSAYVSGKRVLVGSRHFLHDDEGVDCSQADKAARGLRGQGKSLLYIAREGELAGVVAMRDGLRPEAGETLRALKETGVSRLVVLTGDHERTARAIARELPELDEVRAELKPEDKAAVLEDLRRQGRVTAFVGDGVNDAPALMAADVGVCMPAGAVLARETAQVVLMRESIHGLDLARRLALKVSDTLRNCLWSAVGVNSGLLVLAGLGVLPAVASAALHNGTTLGILGYAALRGAGVEGARRLNPVPRPRLPKQSEQE